MLDYRINDPIDVEHINISREVYDSIYRTIGAREPECGGLLGSTNDGKTIDCFVLDYSAVTTDGKYVPNIEYLNNVLAEWDRHNIRPIGMIHSHPHGCTVPSEADLHAAASYMRAAPAFSERFELPIIQTQDSPDGFRIYWYTALPMYGTDKARIIRRKAYVGNTLVSAPAADTRARTVIVPEEDMYERISGLFPTDMARKKTIVAIGCGGSRSFLTQLARIGVGRFILIDGDTAEPRNIATQGVFSDEIGMLKVDAAEIELRRADPYTTITKVPRMLDEQLTDEVFASIVGKVIYERPQDVLICAFTDSFEANARAAALAVKFGTPFLQGLVYKGGTVAEIVFSYPGVTPACPRCCQTSRYEAYLSGSVVRKKDVSANCPISATAILNAYKLEIAEQLLFWNEDSPYGNRLAQHADSNLVMIRLSDHIPDILQGSSFDKATSDANGRSVIGATFWDVISPDDGKNGSALCPLCGGTGNLLNVAGRIADTRVTF